MSVQQVYANNGSRVVMSLGGTDSEGKPEPHTIVWVHSADEVRNRGQVKQLIQKVIDESDRDLLVAKLTPDPRREPNLNTTLPRLQKLFEGFGFTIRDDGLMYRPHSRKP